MVQLPNYFQLRHLAATDWSISTNYADTTAISWLEPFGRTDRLCWTRLRTETKHEMPLFQSEVQDSRGWRSRWSYRSATGTQDRSLTLRSHDQIPASHSLTPKNSFKGFGGIFFQRFWRKIVWKILRKFFSKILEENLSKIFEEIFFKDFGGKLFERFFLEK